MEKVEAKKLIKEETKELKKELVSTFRDMVKQINTNKEFVKETREQLEDFKEFKTKMELNFEYMKNGVDDLKLLVKGKSDKCLLCEKKFQDKLDKKANIKVENELNWVKRIIIGAVIMAILSLILKNGGI
jgi:DNA repair exonuclease SbcCD ATPase subunit